MSNGFHVLRILLIVVVVQAHSQRRHSTSTVPFSPLPFNDSPAAPRTPPRVTPTGHQADEQQMEQFKRLLMARLAWQDVPNVTLNDSHGAGFPSSIVQQLEKETRNHHQQQEDLAAYQQRERNQPLAERAILPGEFLPPNNCRRQLAAKLHLHQHQVRHIDCFRFSKPSFEIKSLPTHQYVKQLRIFVKRHFFDITNDPDLEFTPDMFHVYQVYRPTSNDTLRNQRFSLTDTVRLPIVQARAFDEHWLELTVGAPHHISIQQIYSQFIMPWHGLAISRGLMTGTWPSFIRFTPSIPHLDRSVDDDDSDQQPPYMLVEYEDKLSVEASGRRAARAAPTRPPGSCDPRSPCCRRSLIIDLDQGDNVFNFIIYPRKFDIGECVGQCGRSGSSVNHVEVKNAQHRNEKHSSYNLLLLYHNRLLQNGSRTTTQINRPSPQCCSYSRTGGIDLTYTTANNGLTIKKYIPDMVVEECRCGLPATILQV